MYNLVQLVKRFWRKLTYRYKSRYNLFHTTEMGSELVARYASFEEAEVNVPDTHDVVDPRSTDSWTDFYSNTTNDTWSIEKW